MFLGYFLQNKNFSTQNFKTAINTANKLQNCFEISTLYAFIYNESFIQFINRGTKKWLAYRVLIKSKFFTQENFPHLKNQPIDRSLMNELILCNQIEKKQFQYLVPFLEPVDFEIVQAYK